MSKRHCFTSSAFAYLLFTNTSYYYPGSLILTLTHPTQPVCSWPLPTLYIIATTRLLEEEEMQYSKRRIFKHI